MKLTRTTLAARAHALSQSISASLLDRAELASDARNSGITDYARIIGEAFRRSESTVSHWARTWDWIRKVSHSCRDWVGTQQLPYSFFENAARYEDRIPGEELCQSLLTWSQEPGATLESFRAHLAVLAGKDDDADLCKHLTKVREKILSWVDEMPSEQGGKYLLAASEALSDAIKEVKYEEVPG